MDYTETSYNYQIHVNTKVPVNYISLTDNTTELFLLYDKLTDNVILIEEANIENLINGNFDKHWPSFNDFLMAFFEIN